MRSGIEFLNWICPAMIGGQRQIEDERIVTDCSRNISREIQIKEPFQSFLNSHLSFYGSKFDNVIGKSIEFQLFFFNEQTGKEKS